MRLGLKPVNDLNVEGKADGPNGFFAPEDFQCSVVVAAALTQADAVAINGHQRDQNHVRQDEGGIGGRLMNAVQAGRDDCVPVNRVKGEGRIGVGAGQGDSDACGQQVGFDGTGVDFPRRWPVTGNGACALKVGDNLRGQRFGDVPFRLGTLSPHGLDETATGLPHGGAQFGFGKSGWGK